MDGYMHCSVVLCCVVLCCVLCLLASSLSKCMEISRIMSSISSKYRTGHLTHTPSLPSPLSLSPTLGVSSSVDNEDYFELMIRNAWRMAGGEVGAQLNCPVMH
jgi:hypothetical protein